MAQELKTPNCGWMPARVGLALLTASGIIVLYMARVNFSVAIVEMAVFPGSANSGSKGATSPCIDARGGKGGGGGGGKGGDERDGVGGVVAAANVTSNVTFVTGELEKDLQDMRMVLTGAQRGAVLGSFFYGYVVTQVFGGRSAELYGTKKVFGTAILGGAVLTLLTPLAYRLGYIPLIVVRITMGIFHGVSYPSLSIVSTRWIPALERPRFLAATFTANCVGIVLTMPLCGLLIDAFGWPSVFYVTGGISLVWVAAWAWLMHDFPDKHPRISPEELEYIKEGMKDSNARPKASRIPWRSILTSVPVYAAMAAHMSNMFGWTMLVTLLPTFMKSVFGFAIRENALLSSVPFITRFLGSNVWSWTTDWVLTKELIGVTTCRKIITSLALLGTGLVMVSVTFVGCNAYLAVGLLALATFCNGGVVSGYSPAILEMAPDFAGTLMGYVNTLGSVAAFLSPVITGAITANQTPEEWRIAYGVAASIYAFSTLIFAIFGSASIQPWNFDQRADSGKEEQLPLNLEREPVTGQAPEEKNDAIIVK